MGQQGVASPAACAKFDAIPDGAEEFDKQKYDELDKPQVEEFQGCPEMGPTPRPTRRR